MIRGSRSRVVLAAVLVAAVLVAVPAPRSEAQPAGPTTAPPSTAPARSWSGREAIERLGAGITESAARAGLTVEDLRAELLADPSLKVDANGVLLYVEPLAPVPAAADAPTPEAAEAPFPLEETFELSSRPGSQRTIYLDVLGDTLVGTSWNDNPQFGTDASIAVTPYDSDGAPGTFSVGELAEIQDIWARVAEDYAPFDVNVTTVEPSPGAITRNGSGDQVYGTRVLIGGSPEFSCGCGGVAYLSVFDLTSAHAFYQPALVFTDKIATAKRRGEAASHEVGHNLGLSHDGTGSASYYAGHGPWAPIMGTAYTRAVTQWSAGEYAGANNAQDDLAVIAATGLSPVADDHGNTLGTATPIVGAGVLAAPGEISTRTDVDHFTFDTPGGLTWISAVPSSPRPNLDVGLTLFDSNGAPVASADPAVTQTDVDTATGLEATVLQVLPAGTYTARVDGVGWGTGATGYTDYASLGRYDLTVAFGTCFGDVDGDDDNSLTAPRLMPGESVEGRRCAGDDEDWLRVAGIDGATLSAELSVLDGDLSVAVVNGSGTVLDSAVAAAGTPAELDWTFTANADHFLRITGSPGVESRYSLTTGLTACPPDDQYEGMGGANYDDYPNFAVPLALPGSRDGMSCAGEPNNADFSRVTVPQGGTVVATLRYSPSTDPQLWAFSTAGGSSLAGSTVIGPGLRRLTFTPAAAGNYALAVTYGGSPAAYRLEAEVTQPPSVSITAPTGGTVTGLTTVSATASDPDGSVESVRFLVDGVPFGTDADGSDGWSTTLDAMAYADGTVLEISAIATDDDGHESPADSVSVTVDHPSGARFDFDGDGDTDRGVWRPEVGGWYVDDDGVLGATYLGLDGDLPVAADFDDDGTTDEAVWRSPVGGWYIDDGGVVTARFWGLEGDLPVPMTQDGVPDHPMVFRPSTGGWLSSEGVPRYLGLTGDIPVPGDYDGDGIDDIAVWRPSTGAWYVDIDGAVTTSYLGSAGDVPVQADYDGDGDTDRAVWRPSTGGWFIDDDGVVLTSYLGLEGDVPVVGDYDGDGDDERALWRPEVGGWYVDDGGSISVTYIGLPGDLPVSLPPAAQLTLFDGPQVRP